MFTQRARKTVNTNQTLMVAVTTSPIATTPKGMLKMTRKTTMRSKKMIRKTATNIVRRTKNHPSTW